MQAMCSIPTEDDRPRASRLTGGNMVRLTSAMLSTVLDLILPCPICKTSAAAVFALIGLDQQSVEPSSRLYP